MPIVSVINGNLLESSESTIAQQCNCVTVKAHGLSQLIATRYPWADVYGKRAKTSANTGATPSTPGTIEIMTNGEFTIIHMFAQWTPGKVGAYNRYYQKTYNDTPENRHAWFKKCLDELDILGFPRVAMPYGIGCGLAGGHWQTYEAMLQSAKTNIVLYKRFLK